MYDTQGKRETRTGRTMLMMSLLVLFVAVPALADHEADRRYGVNDRIDGYWRNARAGQRAAYACGPEVEYQRGYERGYRRGSKVGYRHGFNGRRYCGAVPRDFKCESRHFIKGYLDAYGRAYKQGFRRGRADCGARVYQRRYR